jgi:hypothetical protein
MQKVDVLYRTLLLLFKPARVPDLDLVALAANGLHEDLAC